MCQVNVKSASLSSLFACLHPCGCDVRSFVEIRNVLERKFERTLSQLERLPHVLAGQQLQSLDVRLSI
jgi:hypothetical protein